MSPWFGIALIVFLALILIALISIRDAAESTARQMKEVIERLDELCEEQRDRGKALQQLDEPSEWDK